MMHDSVLLAIRQMKDGNGQYLWQPGLRLGVPDTLLGYTYVINQDMASSIASGAITVEFGDLSKYKIRQVRGVRFRRLDELYAGTDEVGFVAFIRQDGDLLDAGTAPVKHIVQV
jgi:HK97 family phage major capsid protein